MTNKVEKCVGWPVQSHRHLPVSFALTKERPVTSVAGRQAIPIRSVPLHRIRTSESDLIIDVNGMSLSSWSPTLGVAVIILAALSHIDTTECCQPRLGDSWKLLELTQQGCHCSLPRPGPGGDAGLHGEGTERVPGGQHHRLQLPGLQHLQTPILETWTEKHKNTSCGTTLRSTTISKTNSLNQSEVISR